MRAYIGKRQVRKASRSCSLEVTAGRFDSLIHRRSGLIAISHTFTTFLGHFIHFGHRPLTAKNRPSDHNLKKVAPQ